VTPDLTGQEQFALSDLALFETLILEAPVAFAFYDTDLRYRRINRMLADMNALSMEAHIGRRPSEILPDPLGPAIEARLIQVLETGAVVSDDDITAPSPITGRLAYYESQWDPARPGEGSIIGIAVLVSDVTERRYAERALLSSNERTVRLQQATQRWPAP
jgi:PAS domain S-box-containing protein